MSSKESDTRSRILEATWKLMEQSRGQGVRMSDIAKAAGISRQAVYLHFETRADLMIATTRYVDDAKGLNERLKEFEETEDGLKLLESIVDVWGNYIPEIIGIAKALLSTRDSDEAAAAAWDESMGCLRDACRHVIAGLERDDKLARPWSRDDAVEMMWTLLSVHTWETATTESGWSQAQYIDRMKTTLRRTFVED